MALVLMGVSGPGKSTVGEVLAASSGWTFLDLDADDLRPASNIEEVHNGAALDDDNRRPWPWALRERGDVSPTPDVVAADIRRPLGL